jgi:DNA-binding NtrC family response regulator
VSIREAWSKVLSQDGHEVLTGDNGRTALELVAAQGPPELIMTDVFMSDMDGVEFGVQLKEAAPGVPSASCWGEGDFGTVGMLDLISRLGAGWTVEKPFDIVDFLAIVNQVLNESRIQTGYSSGTTLSRLR